MNCKQNPRYCRCTEHKAQQQRGYYEYGAKREGRTLHARRGRPVQDPDRRMTQTIEWCERNGGPLSYKSTLNADHFVFPSPLNLTLILNEL